MPIARFLIRGSVPGLEASHISGAMRALEAQGRLRRANQRVAQLGVESLAQGGNVGSREREAQIDIGFAQRLRQHRGADEAAVVGRHGDVPLGLLKGHCTSLRPSKAGPAALIG
jgi:hypothetical protein